MRAKRKPKLITVRLDCELVEAATLLAAPFEMPLATYLRAIIAHHVANSGSRDHMLFKASCSAEGPT